MPEELKQELADIFNSELDVDGCDNFGDILFSAQDADEIKRQYASWEGEEDRD